MRQRWFLVLSAVATSAALGVFAISPVLAGESYTPNARHLMCYKMKDRTKYKGTVVDLFTQKLGKLTNCQVKKAKEFCVPAQKTVNVFGPELQPQEFQGWGCPEDYVCLKIKCDKVDRETQSVLDQFGVRDVELKKPFKVCMPAIKACLDAERTLVESCRDLSDPNSCADAWQISEEPGVGATACFYGPRHGDDQVGCWGCGPANVSAGRCTNGCIDWQLCGGRTFVDECQDLSDPNSEDACDNAWQFGGQGMTSCYYGPRNNDAAIGCWGCGPNNEESALCTNACVRACQGYIEGPSGPTGPIN